MIDVLLAPVYASFLEARAACFAASALDLPGGGFVVGPIGDFTAEKLWEGARARGRATPGHAHRFTFEPMLPCIVYESNADGGGALRFIALVDEIVINTVPRKEYEFPSMKPGRGVAGERAEDEKLPAFVRMRHIEPVSALIAGLSSVPASAVGLKSLPLRRFMFATLRHEHLERAVTRMLTTGASGSV